MKLIGRTLVILTAAMLVVGATWALVGAGFGGGAPGDARERRAFEQRPAGQPGAGRARPGGFEREGGRGPSLFGAGEIVKDLVIIAVIVAIVSLIKRALPRRRARFVPQRGAPPPE
ncbi:MAG: hypothetical protein U0Z44_17240 [Kouleothrix sp.]